jgi:hypothetical protein
VSDGALPNLIVIGAQKCGTGALHYYLDLHPEVQMSSPKELWFFTGGEEDLAPESDRLVSRRSNWSRGLGWYESNFRAEAPVRGESTPAYSSSSRTGTAARMAEVIPDAKLIFLARDPVERMVSHFMHSRIGGAESRPLPFALERPDNVYVAGTRYASMLRSFLQHFPRERILILRQEDLLRRRRETMRQVFRFVGVEEDFWSAKMERERQPSRGKGRLFGLVQRMQGSKLLAPAYRLPEEAKWVLERLAYSGPIDDRPEVSPELRARLLDELEPEIASLEEITGWDLADWRDGAAARSDA